jgi:predicted AAA+ superfamily ATPase
MKRKIYDRLLEWKDREGSKPLMFSGARQVGKTYTIREFGKRNYKNFIEINLLEQKEVLSIYKSDKNADEKFVDLKTLLSIDNFDEDTLLFIDEVQQSKELISELKYVNENHKEMNIIYAGSLLGIMLKRESFPFPVGQVEMIDMFPMSFEEFLWAIKKEQYIDLIKKSYLSNREMSEPLHQKLILFYRIYQCTGGMPEAVSEYVKTGEDIARFNREVIRNIKQAYIKDMAQYVIGEPEKMKIERAYSSVPAQLSNESKKFQYSKITKGAKSRDYMTAIDWLISNRMVIETRKVSTPQIPLKGFEIYEYFKLYLSDIGLLAESLNLSFANILIDNLSFYKGAIAENYVATEFLSNDIPFYYWTSEGNAEIDFLIELDGGVVPVEVKSSENTKAKSLAFYRKKFEPKLSIKVSTKNFGLSGGIKSVPLYAVFCIGKQ